MLENIYLYICKLNSKRNVRGDAYKFQAFLKFYLLWFQEAMFYEFKDLFICAHVIPMNMKQRTLYAKQQSNYEILIPKI